jgi:O-antigen/teichoic acid export membrane protein
MSVTPGGLLVDSSPGEIVDFDSVRSSVGEISRQSALFFTSTIFALACNYFFKVFVARQLGARLIGWNALGMGIYSMAKLAGQMGLPGSAIRFVSAYRSTGDLVRLRGFFWRGLGWSLTGGCTFALATFLLRQWLAMHLFHEPGLASYIPLYALLIPIGIASTFLAGTLKAFQKAARPAVISNFIGLPIIILLSTIGLLMGWSLFAYIVAQLIGEVVTLVLIGIELHKTSRGILQTRGQSLPKIAANARNFALSFLGVELIDFVTNHADRLVIGYFLDARHVGIYAVATSAGVLVTIVLRAISSVFSPMISSLHAQNRQKLLAHLYQIVTKWTLGLTLPLVFVLTVFAVPFLGLFGSDFRAGWPVLIIIVAAEIIDCGVGSVGQLLMMSGNESRYIRTQTVLAPIILGMKLVLIPSLGLTGAAIGSALGIVVSNLAYLWHVRKCLGMQPLNRGYTRLVVPAFSAAGAVLLLRVLVERIGLAAVPTILLALGAAYAVFLGLALLALNREERTLAVIAWQRTRSLLRLAPQPA